MFECVNETLLYLSYRETCFNNPFVLKIGGGLYGTEICERFKYVLHLIPPNTNNNNKEKNRVLKSTNPKRSFYDYYKHLRYYISLQGVQYGVVKSEWMYFDSR